MNETVIAAICGALAGHGVEFQRAGDIVLVENGCMRLIASIHQGDSNTNTVTLEVLATSEVLNFQTISECFAGQGATSDLAVNQAFVKFLTGSFHVLLQALTPHQCADQVEVERWSSTNGNWDVYSGPLITQSNYSEPQNWTHPNYANFFESLKLRSERVLPYAPHWFRVYLGVLDGQIIASEALLDNRPWDEAQADLVSADWTHVKGFGALRHFAILRPARSQEQLAERVEPVRVRLIRAVLTFVDGSAHGEIELEQCLTNAGFSASDSTMLSVLLPIAFAKPVLLDQGVIEPDKNVRAVSQNGNVVPIELSTVSLYADCELFASECVRANPILDFKSHYLLVAGISSQLNAAQNVLNAGGELKGAISSCVIQSIPAESLGYVAPQRSSPFQNGDEKLVFAERSTNHVKPWWKFW